MHPRIREIVDQSFLLRKTVEEIAFLLPADPAELQDWLSGAVARRDAQLFTFLVVAAIHLERPIASSHLGRGLHLILDPHFMCMTLRRAQGDDIPERLLEALQNTAISPSHQAALLFTACEWCKQHREGAFPPELLTLARLHARKADQLDTKACAYLISLGHAVEDQRVIDLLITHPADTAAREDVIKASGTVSDIFREIITGPVADILRKEPTHQISGFTVRRSVQHIGRNEPCHCGSGRKYKRCCFQKDAERLEHSTHIPGMTLAEIAAAPEQHLDEKSLMNAHPIDLSRMDPRKIDPDLLSLFHARLSAYKLWEEYLTSIETVGWGDEIEPTLTYAFHCMSREGRKELVERLLALRRLVLDPPCVEPPADYVRLLLVRDDPAAFLHTVDEIALEAVETDHFISAHSLAISLLFSARPALGILVARAVIPVAEKTFALELLEEILIAREKLNLPPGEPAADILDKRFANDAIAGGAQETAKLREARQKLKAKADQVRRIQSDLDHLRAEVERREAKQTQKSPEKPSPHHPPAAPPDTETLRDLREKVATLKSALKDHHQERDTLRRDLSKTLTDLEALREVKSSAPPNPQPPTDPEDRHLLPGDVDGNQPPRLIEFPKKFHHTLTRHPRHIARGALVLLGRLAAGEPDAFIGVVRLKQRPDTLRARIGIDHRLLFRLDSETLHVVDLIPRQDLERRIKTL